MTKKLTLLATAAFAIGYLGYSGPANITQEPVVTPVGGQAISQPKSGGSFNLKIINSVSTLPNDNNASTKTAPTIASASAPTETKRQDLAPASYATTVDAKRVGDRAVTADGTSYQIHNYKTLAIPNDPNANQPYVTSANLSAAWDVPRGSHETLLAVIDTGFSLQHEEFAGRFYISPGESGVATAENPSLLNCTARSLPLTQSCNLIDDNGDGTVDNEVGTTTKQNPSRLNCTGQSRTLFKDCNLIDDDANGFIDDVTGWDFINNDRSVQAGEVTPTGAGVHHGSYVAGVAAATGNNGKGIAGADWGTKILPIQALDDDGSGDTVGVANSIDYAVARRADVISLSLGSDFDDALVRQAVRRAVAAGIIVVAAAGNDGCACMVYPGNYPEVLAVGASNSTGQPASFSSFGPNLDILAPGTNLYTTDWTPANPTNAYASGISGTSLATPIVAGMLTRMKSQRPTSTPAQLIANLTESSNPLGLTATNPRTNTLGFGSLNAGKASVRLVNSYAPVQLLNFSKISQIGITSALLYQCDPGVIGTTPVYEFTKAGTTPTFTTSELDRFTASNQGFTVSIFAYTCTTQPHDTPQSIRTLNVLSEFRNLFIK